jgi:hypothetical protein
VSGGAGSASDLDFLLLEANGFNVLGAPWVAGGRDNNVRAAGGSGDAVEVVTFVNEPLDINGDGIPDVLIDSDGDGNQDTVFNIAFEHVAGPAPNLVKYVAFGNVITINEHQTNSSTAYGHANAGDAISVGAAFYQDTPRYGTAPPQLEFFSSHGGTDVLLDSNGNRLATPLQPQSPDIVAPDGVNTTFFGFDDPRVGGVYEADGFPNFFGTSAAAPHAAALAALIREAVPGITVQDLENALQDGAIDMGDPGVDNETGWGLIHGQASLLEALDANYFVVTDTSDQVDQTPLGDGQVDVDPATNGDQITLRAAIQEANASGGDWTIILEEGTYRLNQTGTELNDASNNDLDITANITIIGNGADNTVINANNIDRVFEVLGGAGLDLTGVTILDGKVGIGQGGGIATDGELTLTEVAIESSEALLGGAGLSIRAGGSATIVRSTLSNNVTTDGRGGGILVDGRPDVVDFVRCRGGRPASRVKFGAPTGPWSLQTT